MHYFTPEKLIEAGMNEIGKVSLMFFKKDCMGCHACEVACPFGAMQFDDDQDLAFNPDCAVASYCDLKILAATLVSRFCSSTYL